VSCGQQSCDHGLWPRQQEELSIRYDLAQIIFAAVYIIKLFDFFIEKVFAISSFCAYRV